MPGWGLGSGTPSPLGPPFGFLPFVGSALSILFIYFFFFGHVARLVGS